MIARSGPPVARSTAGSASTIAQPSATYSPAVTQRGAPGHSIARATPSAAPPHTTASSVWPGPGAIASTQTGV